MQTHRGGFSLVELMVIVAIVAILAVVAAPSFTDFLARQRINNAASQLYGDLQFARSEAVQRNTRVALTFDSSAWCYVIHTVASGVVCSCTAAGSGSCANASAVALKGVGGADFPGVSLALSSGLSSLVFEPLRGGLEAGGTAGSASFTGSAGSLQIQVNSLGRVRLCAPSGSGTGGHPPC